MMLVHNNERQVQRLINYLSHDFDIFVHIDKKSKINILNKDNVFVYRIYKIYWGSFNQIMATLFLLKEAYKKKYNRYLLISGSDLPIKNNSEIKAFFNGNEYEYITGERLPIETLKGNGGLDRMLNYWPNNFSYDKSITIKVIFKLYLLMFFIFSKFNKRLLDYEFYKGANWTNYTNNCVMKIFEFLDKDKNYIKRFKWTKCADEIFFQTIIFKLDNINTINNSLRYVDWKTGPEKPRILREGDYNKIIASNALFARKFDENIDKNIIKKIYEMIGEKNNISKCTAGIV